MNNYKILFDLSVCLDKSASTIYSDICALFNLLNQSSSQIAGLLYAKDRNLFVERQKKLTRIKEIEQAHYFFHEALNHEPLFLTGILSSLKLKRFFRKKKKQYDYYPIDKLFNEVIWRIIFNGHISDQAQASIVKNNFYFTSMTSYSWSTLETSDIDFIIFSHVNPMRVTGNTTKIIRFRDPIAITDPDFSTRQRSNQFACDLKQASEDSYFVCDSEVAKTKLVSFYLQLEKKSYVIANPIHCNYTRVNDFSKLLAILRTRIVFPGKNISNDLTHFNYLFTVSSCALEENILTLIQAWEKINYQYSQNIKLIIVIKTDTISRDIENAMHPHREQGNLILLQGLTDIEMAYLYSHALVYISAVYAAQSYSELLIAMHYACPIVASDIPLYRWVMQDAALFGNPYSVDDISHAIAQIIESHDSEQLVKRGLERVKLFSYEAIEKEWKMFFDNIKNKRQQNFAALKNPPASLTLDDPLFKGVK